jgi:phosphate-selective porin OprO/OprP
MCIEKFIVRATAVSAASIVLLNAQPLCAESSSDTTRIEKLERAVEQLQKQNGTLEQRNAELEQKISVLEKRTASVPNSAVTSGRQKTASVPDAKFKTKVTYDGKTYVEKAVVDEPKPSVAVVPRGTELKLVLGGYIQANFEDGDVFAFYGNFGQTAIKDRFRLRRARLNLTGDFAEQFDFKMEGDFSQGDGISSNRTDFSATDIFVNWHRFPEAQIKVGQWKAPFGLEQLTPDPSLIIIERSLPTGAITPERQIGIQLWGKPFAGIWPDQKDLLTYYAGIFNGNGRNSTVNDNNNFMYVGRLESMLFKKKIWGQDSFVQLGADVLNSRDDKGTNISQSGNLLVNTDGSLSPFTLPGADERTAWSVDAWFELGRFDLIGEYFEEYVNGRTVNGVPPGFANFTTDGYYITAAYFLIPKKLQLAVQWQDLNPGQKGNDGIRSVTGGLNYYIHGDDLKLMVNYIHTWSDFRQANPQFGDDQFDEVIGRIQLMF